MNKVLLLAASLALLAPPAFGQESSRPAGAGDPVSSSYKPNINPADFTHVISNKYYTLKPGTKATYEKKSPKASNGSRSKPPEKRSK